MMKIRIIIAFLVFTGLLSCSSKYKVADYPVVGIPFNEVKLEDPFWLPKTEINRTVTIPASFAKCEEMGRMDNFLIAGGKMPGKVKGLMPFDDTDVYKVIEGASYSLTTHYDKDLDEYLDSVIAIIATGQEKDGYLTTYKTIDTTFSPAPWCPPAGKWKNLSCSHELYNSGHMFEAAAAHYRATGKTSFLNIATRNADLLVKVFGNGRNPEVPGHQIVETGLVKLFLITQKKEYLELAKQFLDNRGDSTKREIRGEYSQDHIPVIHQKEAVGHAVRAGYMYAGMTDIAALFMDEAYSQAVSAIWENVVNRKLYLTGGIGARHEGEAFGKDYELPNLTAYNETCAAIANVYWNYRMFQLFGDAKYIDVLERSLYNGVLSGVGIDGKTFFYPNPLECNMQFRFNSGGSLTREPWFDCSCCPTNVCRFIPSVPGYVYAKKDMEIYVNLYMTSSTKIKLSENISIGISQETLYPWDGKVKISLTSEKKSAFIMKIRIPGWAQNRPVPGDLYTYLDSESSSPDILVNNERIAFEISQGYAVLERVWDPGDVIDLSFPMTVRRTEANSQVLDCQGKVALERGPIVFCFEGNDNTDGLSGWILPDSTSFKSDFQENILGGIVTLTGNVLTTKEGQLKPVKATAIPYFAWNNRGANEMAVWIGRKSE